MLRSLLCAALMAYGSAALAQEDPSAVAQEPQDPASPSPSPSPSPEPSPSPSPSPEASPSPAASPTPAPKPAGPITALVKAVPQRTVFVGNEPVTVVYHLVAATGVAVNPAPLATLDGEFVVVSVALGERTGIPGVKDLHVQRVTLVVRFPHEGPLGPHQIPGTTLQYSQDVIVEKEGALYRKPVIGTVAVPPVKLEKVAAYVETDILHETTFLGDPNDARLTVHMGPEAELLNEFPPQGAPAPEGVTFLSAFKPAEPFVLLATSRTSHDTGTYSITSFVYRFSVLDIGPKPFPFAFPSVQVRRRDDAQSQITVIAPGTTNILIRPRVDKKTPAEPLKGAVADPARERLLFWQLPVAAGGLLTAYMSLTGITSFISWARSRKDRKRKRSVAIDEELPEADPVYETAWFRRWTIRRRAQAELRAYNTAPDRAACERLRGVVARFLAAYLKGAARVDRTRAQTLPAASFTTTPDSVLAYWQGILAKCEWCLERNQYTAFDPRHEE